MNHKTKIILLAIIFLGLFGLAESSEAKELYVNGSTGNDSTAYATNDAAHPWATIKRAAWGSTVCASKVGAEAAQPGDTVNVAAGTYSVNRDCADSASVVTYRTENNGSVGNPITFLASGTVVLEQTGNLGPIIGANSKDYITWDGFYLDEANITTASDTGPVAIFGASNITIQNCTIIGTGMSRWPDNHKGIAIQGGSSYITIKNNRISNFYTYGVSVRNGAGIQVYNTWNFTIENNEIYDVGTGIFLKEGRNYGYGNSIVRYNLIYNCSGGAGVELNDLPNIAPTGEIKIYSNVIRDSITGISFQGNSAGTADAPAYGKAVNNTIDNVTNGIKINWPSWILGNIVWNNIITNATVVDSGDATTGRAIFSYAAESDSYNGDESLIDFEHNMYYTFSNFSRVNGVYKTFATWQSSYSQDSASTVSTSTTDPLFANSAANDFRLCTAAGVPHASCSGASPAIGRGIDILDLDGDGQTNDAITLGAYITGNETIGLTSSGSGDTTAPASPRGLTVQ